MGVDVCYFLDHDLPATNPQQLYEELKKRIPDKEIILHNCETIHFYKITPVKNTWYILYLDTCPEITLHYEDDIYQIHVEIYKNVVDSYNIDKNGKTAFDWMRWNHMVDLFMENDSRCHEWFSTMITTLKETLVPILHSKKLLLTADSSSYRHETLYGDFLMEQGKTIEEALEMNNSFNPPCKVWRNKESFGRPESDYEGDGDDWVGPFFVFDLDIN